MFYVYILCSVTLDRYFVGRTSNLKGQLLRHNHGKNVYTKSGIPWRLVYKESFKNSLECKKREAFIKSADSRAELRAIIRSTTNEDGNDC